MSSAEVSKIGERAQMTKAGSPFSNLSSQHSTGTAPHQRNVHSLKLGADSADPGGPPQVWLWSPSVGPSLCTARPGADADS